MKSQSIFDIAIIGSGFSGTMTAVNLMQKKWPHPVKAVLVDSETEPGRGLAYKTNSASHLLNVQAGNMSAMADSPDDFITYLRAHVNHSAKWSDFASRKDYGNYIQFHLKGLKNTEKNNFKCSQMASTIDNCVKKNGLYICFSKDQEIFRTKNLIIAVGVPSPGLPTPIRQAQIPQDRLIGDPWNFAKFNTIDPDDNIVFVGSGLTMIDKVLELLDKHHRGRMIAVSRRGLMPQPHIESLLTETYPQPLALPDSMTPLEALRYVRQAIKQVGNWRAVIDSLRNHSNQWWCGLSAKEKAQFNRHLQPYWDSHRHRMAPQAALRIAEAIKNGQLILKDGSITDCRFDDTLKVDIRRRRRTSDAAMETIAADKLINCTGPEANIFRNEIPLVQMLLAHGIVSANELKAGVRVDQHLSPLNGNEADGQCFIIGALLRGSLFETFAVPELRNQAKVIADKVHGKLMSEESAFAGAVASQSGSRHSLV